MLFYVSINIIFPWIVNFVVLLEFVPGKSGVEFKISEFSEMFSVCGLEILVVLLLVFLLVF